MIATDDSTFMQSLRSSPSPLITEDLSVVGDVMAPHTFVSKQIVSPQSPEEEASGMLRPRSRSPAKRKVSSAQDAKPVQKLTRRQLKHREAMVRFRQRKKVKISALEEQEHELQRQLEATLQLYHERELQRLMTNNELLVASDPRVNLQRAIVDAVLQIESILDENDALDEVITEHEKFHATLKRVRERSLETSIWKCL